MKKVLLAVLSTLFIVFAGVTFTGAHSTEKEIKPNTDTYDFYCPAPYGHHYQNRYYDDGSRYFRDRDYYRENDQKGYRNYKDYKDDGYFRWHHRHHYDTQR